MWHLSIHFCLQAGPEYLVYMSLLLSRYDACMACQIASMEDASADALEGAQGGGTCACWRFRPKETEISCPFFLAGGQALTAAAGA